MVDQWQGLAILLLGLAQLHHSWCHLQNAKDRQKVMEMRHAEERLRSQLMADMASTVDRHEAHLRVMEMGTQSDGADHG